jgi:hypothetical protein
MKILVGVLFTVPGTVSHPGGREGGPRRPLGGGEAARHCPRGRRYQTQTGKGSYPQ